MSASASKELIEKLSPVSVNEGDYRRTGVHLDLNIEPGGVRPAVELLRDRGYFLEDLTAVDEISRRVVIYHFNRHIEPHRVALRATLGPDDRIDSVQDIFSAANWQERECYEFLGVNFQGHPELKQLLLPEDFTAHPLRKDFTVPAEALAPEYKQD